MEVRERIRKKEVRRGNMKEGGQACEYENVQIFRKSVFLNHRGLVMGARENWHKRRVRLCV